MSIIPAEEIHAEKYFDPIHPIEPNQKVYIFWNGDREEINCNILLDIPNTGVEVYGLLFGKKEAKVQINMTITHRAINTSSKVILKGLLADKANVSFKGLTKIEKGAKNTNAWLSCYYLLLSKETKGKAIPSLEILENDVIAGHATTASKLKETDVFYLMSRGLNYEKARQLLVEGFITDLFPKIPQEIRHLARMEMKNGY